MICSTLLSSPTTRHYLKQPGYLPSVDRPFCFFIYTQGCWQALRDSSEHISISNFLLNSTTFRSQVHNHPEIYNINKKPASSFSAVHFLSCSILSSLPLHPPSKAAGKDQWALFLHCYSPAKSNCSFRCSARRWGELCTDEACWQLLARDKPGSEFIAWW